MTRALGPNVGLGREVALPFGILALCWLPIGAGGLVWLAGGLSSWALAGAWYAPSFDVASGKRFLAHGPKALWPSVEPRAVWVVAAMLLLTLVAPAAAWVGVAARTRTRPGDPLGALATLDDVRGLGPVDVARRAATLRPSLTTAVGGTGRAARENGVLLGRLRSRRGSGAELRASWEDVVLAVMAPRAGKTTALAVPAIIDAPGPVVATSNKADLWAATASVRARDSGAPVWVFDPQRITGVDRTWWWNPLRGVTTVEEAHRLAGHFIQEVRAGQGDRDFWTSAALDLLTGLLLAASLSGRGLDEVYEWLNDPVLSTPVQVLRECGHKAAAASLSGRQHGAPETRDGVYETARTAAQCLRDGDIMAWVTRPSGPSPELDPRAMVRTQETLYLLSKDGAGGAAPLVAALADRVMREAVQAAEWDGGRLDPPMVVVLDEAANVCRIADLPELYSHLGSRGVLPVTILQSYRQGTRVWGEHGMDALWSAATCKLLGAGLDDAKLVEDISRLVGDHDVAVRSISRGDGRVSESVSLRRQRVLPPEEIRALPKGTALLLATGCRPAMVTLQPWYDGDRVDAIRAAISQAAKQQVRWS
jgi:type IV secretory pathway TraG/TraD family ATPase VirD4